jgi:hypothetical protein
VNVATPVVPSVNVMLIGPKSAPLMVAPAGYSSWFMMKCQPSRFGSHCFPTLENGALPTLATVPALTLPASDVPALTPTARPLTVRIAPVMQSIRAARR